jgi:hypothetical protein
MPRKRRTVWGKPPVSVEEVLRWADEYRRRAGCWPTNKSGRITSGPGLTWNAVDQALAKGYRGLPGGASLATLLAERRGHRHRLLTAPLKVNDILRWADGHRRRTGVWPTRSSGRVADAPGETWSGVDRALQTGTRGLRFQTSLAAVLSKRRGRPRQAERPPLTVERIRAWAEAYRVLYGGWPTKDAGPVGNTGENWLAIDNALRHGLRGLPGGSSLSQLLQGRG